MINANLVPTSVVDRNGRVTTVHKKPVAAPSAASALSNIAPSLSAPEADAQERVFQPTKKQIEQRHHSHMLRPGAIDRRLPAGPRGYDSYSNADFTASDMEIYDVMSVTRDNETALVLLRDGIRSAKDAADYLSAEDRYPLMDDRSEMATKALARRLDSETLIKFSELYNPGLWHSGEHLDMYLDAAELYSYPKFQQKKGPLFSDILNGRIRLSDIKTIGIRTSHVVLTDLSNDLSTLHNLADGSANYTAEQLRDAFKTSDGNSATYFMINLMCQRHGGEWASGIDWHVGIPAQEYWRRQNKERRGKDHAEEKAFISYVDQFHKKGACSVDDMYALFTSGVELEFAAEKTKQFPVQQVIAMHEGIAPPVTDGWL
jgi:hypothetical protein